MMTADMRAMIGGLGDQLAWAGDLDRLPALPDSELLVCGMGGSGIAGDFLAALAEPVRSRVTVHKTFGLPGWAAVTTPTVIAVSYSGNTAETLSAGAQAKKLGLEVVVVTTGGSLAVSAADHGWASVTVPGGLQPRAALGYLLGGALRVAEAAGAVEEVPFQLDEAARVVRSLVEPGSAGWQLAADLASGLDGRVAAIYGAAGLTAPVANRWKTQINENAKWPAWFSLIPELDHNEIVAWEGQADLSARKVGIVALRDREEPPELRRRFELTRRLTERRVPWVGEVEAQGESPLARMLSLTVVGDMVSVELARLAGVDPVPVPAIEELKRLLEEET